jgi:hypothetical protein
MRRATAIIVLAGLALSAVLAPGMGTNATALVLLGLIALVGVLALAVARKADSGAVEPVVCNECGGLNSPNTPYCKHCGAPVRNSAPKSRH